MRLAGSRAEGRAHDLSDWDLDVLAYDFDAVAADLSGILEPFAPLTAFWDPYADHDAYMTILPGPTKVDICFFDRPREWSRPWGVRRETVEAIDRHFWDWILWTEQKRRGGYEDRCVKSLRDMFELMLRPMGVPDPPATVPAAVHAYLQARERLERELGVSVARRLENEVRPLVAPAS